MRMHGRKLLLGIQEILSLARAAARLFKPGATECRSSERSSTERLRTALARSLDDGTAEGRHQKEQFLRLTSLVCASLRSRHHVQTVSLHEAYRGHDPSEMAASAEDRASAAAFSESLHWSVMSAGFTLCSREDELRALHGHFGDEEMWNVPVVMDWKAIDSSLVSAAEGGFDAYAAEEAHGRAVTRPSWASKLTVYHRGTGVIEKRGYFVGAKIEELTTRKLRALGAAAVRLGRAAVSPLVDGLGRPLAGLVERRVERLLERSVLLRELTRKLSPPPSSEVRDRIFEVRDRISKVRDRISEPPACEPTSLSNTTCSSNRGFQAVDLSLVRLLEETTLSAPTYRHVLLVYRHTQSGREAHGNGSHVALGLYRNVPQSDLELLLPHMVVTMPELQRGQFVAMSAVGLWAASPLLAHEAMSYTGLVTLYTVGALAVRTAFRWRGAKQLYQQLLLSYQHKNRVGSADGALLCAARLAEEEQISQALTIVHALLATPRAPRHLQHDALEWREWREHQAELRAATDLHVVPPPRRRAPLPALVNGCDAADARPISSTALRRAHVRVLGTWSDLAGIESHVWRDWRLSALPQLLAMGLVELVRPEVVRPEEASTDERRVGRSRSSEPAVDGDEVWVRLKPLDEAIRLAEAYWHKLPSVSAPGYAAEDMPATDEASPRASHPEGRPPAHEVPHVRLRFHAPSALDSALGPRPSGSRSTI